MTADLRTIAGYAVREGLRRRVLAVVTVLTVAFLALYGWGASEAFEEVAATGGSGSASLGVDVLTGATLLGLAMFVTLFLGTVLAVFLTLGTVRGDAERGLLQPLVVRPVGRTTLLLARFLAAAGICVAYVVTVYVAAMLITNIAGGFWPGRPVAAGVGMAAAVVLLVALSLLGSTVLSTTANGIAVFMLFGAGLTAGLLGQIGEALGSASLDRVASIASWVLPFEALYQQGLHALTADLGGLTGIVVQLGPFGGARDAGPLLWPYAALYLAVLAAVAVLAFRRADL